MSTIFKYQPEPLKPEWDKGLIYDCCRKETPEDPKCTDCCYDSWKDEFKKVIQTYNKVKEIADQAQKRYDLLADRRNRFKTWKDELDKAEELARAICHQLEIIAGQLDKIWYNACNAAKAIRILFCMLREFFSQVDYLKIRYDDLQTCILKNTDPSLEPGKGILACLKTYYDKLDAVIKTRDEIIKAIVEAVKIAELLRNNMNTQPCPKGDFDPCKDLPQPPCNCSGDQPEYGFKTIICDWLCAFKCDEKCGQGQEQQQQQQQKYGYANTQPPPPAPAPDPCVENCELEPIITFPVCNDPYKKCVENWYAEDDACVKQLAEDIKQYNKDKEALLACKQSLELAIKEADPKNRCK